jgi:hypothetical protein
MFRQLTTFSDLWSCCVSARSSIQLDCRQAAVGAIYACSLADKATGRRSLMMLIALATLGLLPLAWL